MHFTILGLAAVISLSCLSPRAHAAGEVASTFTLDGQLYGDAIAKSVLTDTGTLTLQILDPAQTCVLYEETQSFDTRSSEGAFQATVGSPTGAPRRNGTSGLDSNHPMALIYSNVNPAGINGKSFGGAGCSYVPNLGDARYLRVTVFTTSDANTRVLSPNLAIDSVPAAVVAERAETLGGVAPAGFAQLETPGNTDLTQANLEAVFQNYAALTNLLGGSSAAYMRSGSSSAAQLPQPTSPPSNATAAANEGQIWYDGPSHQIRYSDGSAVQTLGAASSTMVTNVATLTNGSIWIGDGGGKAQARAPSGDIMMSNTGVTRVTSIQNVPVITTAPTTSGQVLRFNSGTGAYVPAFIAMTDLRSTATGSSMLGTACSASQTLTFNAVTDAMSCQNISLSAGQLTANTVTTAAVADNVITSAKLNTTGIATNRLLITDPTNGTTVQFATCATDETLKFGATGWTCASVASLSPVSSVAGKTGAVALNAADVSGLGTAALLDHGTAANQAVRLDASAKIPAVDGSQLTALNAVKIQTRDVASTAPNAGQVLTWNASATRWEPASFAMGSVTSVAGGTGLLGGPITSSGTLAVNVGTASNQILQLNGSAQIPAVDGSLLTAVNSTKLQTRTVAATAPTPGQVLGWNSSNAQWEPTTPATGSVVNVAAGNGLLGGPITTSGTLSVNTGTIANSIVQLNASAQIPAVDGSLLYAVKLGSRSVATTAPSSWQVLGWNATSSQWEPTSITTGTITSIATGAGLLGGTITSSGTLAVNVGTTSNQILQLNGSAQIPAVDGSLLTAVNAVKLQTRTVAATAPTLGQVLGWNSSTAQWEPTSITTGTITSIATGAGLLGGPVSTSGTISVNLGTAANQIVQLNSSAQLPTVDGSLLYAVKLGSRSVATTAPNNLQVLGWNSSSAQWEPTTPATGSVTNIAAGNGLLGGPITSSGTLAVNVGTASSQILQLNGSAQIPAVDGSLLTAVNSTKLQTRTVAATAPTLGQVLGWNSSSAQWEPTSVTSGTVTSIATGAGLLGGPVSTSGTISVNLGTAANQIVQLNSSAQIPALDGSLLYAVKLGSRSVATTAPSTSQVLGWNSSTSVWEPTSVSSGTVTSVATGAGLLGGPVSTSGTISVNLGTAANQIVQLNASAQLPAVDGSQLTAVNATKLQARTLAATAPSFGQVLGWNSSSSQWEPTSVSTGTVNSVATGAGLLGGPIISSGTLAVNVGTSSNQILQLNGSAQVPAVDGSLLTAVNSTKLQARGVAATAPSFGQVLGWNSSSAQWEPTSITAGTVTSVATGAGLLGGPVSTSGTISVNLGTAANQIVQLNASAQLPAVDGSQLTAVNASKLQTRTIAATSPVAGQVLGWNAPGNQWEPVTPAAGSVVRVATGTGLLGGPITSNGTLSVDVGTAANQIVQFNASAQIATGGGSAAAPAHAFADSASTGMFSPAANQLALATNGASALNILANGRVGVGTNAPATNLEVAGALRLSTTTADTFTTPTGVSVPTKLNIPIYDPGAFGQVVALGVPAGAQTSSRALSLFDARTSAHQPTLSVLSPDETQIFGLSFDGDNTVGFLKSSVDLGFSARGSEVGRLTTNTSTNDTALAIKATGAAGAAGVQLYQNATAVGYVGLQSNRTSFDVNSLYFGVPLRLGTNAGTAITILSGNNNVGVGTSSPAAAFDVYATGTNSALVVPRDSTANRPAANAVNGMLRYNTSSNAMETYANGAWQTLAAQASGGSGFLPLSGGTMTGAIVHGNGTVGAPSLSFANDPSTGLYSTSAGIVNLATSGTARFTMLANGNAGFGTASPNTVLELASSGFSGPLRLGRANNASMDNTITLNPSGGYTTAMPRWDFGTFANEGSFKLKYNNGSAGLALTVDSTGNLGVGTAVPAAGLDVATTGSIASAIIVPRDSQANRPSTPVNGMLRYNNSASVLEAYANGTWQTLAAQTSGGSGFLPLSGGTMTGAIQQSVGSMAAPGLSFANDATTGFYSTGAGVLNLATAGTTRLTVLANGNVGIGTATPANSFNVQRDLGVAAAENHLGAFQRSTGSNAGVSMGYRASGSLESAGFLRATGGLPLVLGTSGVQAILTLTNSGNATMSGLVGIGTATPQAALDVATTGTIASAIIVPRDSTANRPTVPVNGMLRYASDTSSLEGYVNGSWQTLASQASGGSGFLPLSGGTTTGAIVHANGTVGAPSVSFANDVTTGLYSSGAGVLNLATAGSTRLTVISNGNVGVGTATPGTPLQVQSGSNFIQLDPANSKIRIFNSGNMDGQLTANGTGIVANNTFIAPLIKSTGPLVSAAGGSNGFTASGLLDLWSASGSPNYITFSETSVANRGLFGFGAGSGDLVYRGGATTMSNGTEYLRITSGGNVGLGTMAPQAGLDVALTGTIASAIIVPRDSTANRPTAAVNGMLRYNNSINVMEAYVNGTWQTMSSSIAGYLSLAGGTMTGPIVASNGAVGAPGVAFANDATTGLYSAGTGILNLATAGTARLTISPMGYVGIGSASPALALDVSAPISGQIAQFSSSTGAATFAVQAQPASSAGVLLRKAVANGGRWNLKSNAATESGSNVGSDFQIEGLSDAGASLGNYLTILRASGNVGINSTTPATALDIIYASSGTSGTLDATSVINNFTPAAGSSAIVDGKTITTNLTTSSPQTGSVRGLQTITNNKGTGAASSVIGLLSTASQNHASGTTNNLYGLYSDTVDVAGTTGSAFGTYDYVRNAGSGSITNAYGNYNWMRNVGTGTVSNSYGVFSLIQNDSAGGNITKAYNFYGKTPSNNGTIGTFYGLYLEDIGTSPGFAIYSAGGNSYLAGNVGIGSTAPQAKLEVVGHVAASGPAATIGACGVAPSLTGNDTRGMITLGTGGLSACTITFATAFVTAPICMATWQGATAPAVSISAAATTALVTFNFSATINSGSVGYICLQ